MENTVQPSLEPELGRKRTPANKLDINYKNRKNTHRPTWDEYFLNVAEAISHRSHDGETKVGCVIIDDNKRIMATGYNGFPPGCDDSELPNLRPDKYPFMVHAEINAIASSRQDLRGSTAYLTYNPCRDCAKAIITAGIKNVVYGCEYLNDDKDFIFSFLKKCGVNVRHVPFTDRPNG